MSTAHTFTTHTDRTGRVAFTVAGVVTVYTLAEVIALLSPDGGEIACALTQHALTAPRVTYRSETITEELAGVKVRRAIVVPVTE